jgi:hypothetical protein
MITGRVAHISCYSFKPYWVPQVSCLRPGIAETFTAPGSPLGLDFGGSNRAGGVVAETGPAPPASGCDDRVGGDAYLSGFVVSHSSTIKLWMNGAQQFVVIL